MSKVWNRSDYIVSQGLPKPGRGRPSRETIALLDKAVSEGVKFTDYPKVKVVEKSKKTGRTKTVTKIAPEAVNNAAFVSSEPAEIWPVNSTKVYYTNEKGKRVLSNVTTREVCRTCKRGVSLVYCTCQHYGMTPSAMIESGQIVNVELVEAQ